MSIYKGIKQYRHIRELGEGGFGQVVLAQQCDTKQPVAIKIMSLEKHKECNNVVGRLVQNEVNALTRIKQQLSHDLFKQSNVVGFIEYFKDDKNSYLVLQYCNGGTLENFLQQQTNKKVDESTFQKFLLQLLNGMYQLHSCNIIHRDLKTDNILIHNNKLIIADLGFCDIFDEQNTVFNLNLGTIGYKAPEIIYGMPYGIQADMFSLGVVFFEMCIGQKPFRQSNDVKEFLADSSQNIHIQKLDKANINEDLKEILKKMLLHSAHQRITWTELYQTSLFKKSSMIIEQENQQRQSDIQNTYSKLQNFLSNYNDKLVEVDNQPQGQTNVKNTDSKLQHNLSDQVEKQVEVGGQPEGNSDFQRTNLQDKESNQNEKLFQADNQPPILSNIQTSSQLQHNIPNQYNNLEYQTQQNNPTMPSQPQTVVASKIYKSVLEYDQIITIQNLYSKISQIQISDYNVVIKLQGIDEQLLESLKDDKILKLNYLFPRVLIMKQIYQSTLKIIEEYQVLSQSTQNDSQYIQNLGKINDSSLEIKQTVYDSYAYLMGNRKELQLDEDQRKEFIGPFEKSIKYDSNFTSSLNTFSQLLEPEQKKLIQFIIRIYENPHFEELINK